MLHWNRIWMSGIRDYEAGWLARDDEMWKNFYILRDKECGADIATCNDLPWFVALLSSLI